MFRVALNRAFLSRYFLGAVLLILLAHLLNFSGVFLDSIMLGQSDVVFFYDYSIGWGAFLRLMVLACGLSAGLLFAEDNDEGALRYHLLRGSKRGYIGSRIMTCTVAGGSVMVVSTLLVLFLLSLRIPFIEDDPIRILDLRNDIQGFLFQTESPAAYIIYYCYTGFCFGALWSATALLASTYTKNHFAILSAPLLFSQVMSILFSVLRAPAEIRPFNLVSGYYRISDSVTAQVLWPLFISLLYILPILWLSYGRIMRIINE